MTKLSLYILALSFIFALPHAYAASDEGDHSHEHTPLEDEMSAMNKSWRLVRRAIKDPSKNEATLENVAKVLSAAKKSVKMTPMLADNLSGEAKEKFMTGYQKLMEQTVVQLGELENALKENDNTKAEAIVTRINDMRKEGHEKYKPEDD